MDYHDKEKDKMLAKDDASLKIIKNSFDIFVVFIKYIHLFILKIYYFFPFKKNIISLVNK